MPAAKLREAAVALALPKGRDYNTLVAFGGVAAQFPVCGGER